jgi:hypothetical protein
MAESTNINLPRSHSARFPDRCVVCDHDDPVSHVRIMTVPVEQWTWLLWWFGKPFVTKAPACTDCAWKLHALRFVSLVVAISITVAALWLIWPHFKDPVPHGMRKYAMAVLVLLCLLPQLIFEVFFARPFGINADVDGVDYEFTSKDYAVDFAKQNIDAMWVKVNGEFINQ